LDERIKKTVLQLLERIKRILLNISKHKYLKSERVPWATGYSQYKYDSIGELINSERLSCFSEGRLPPGYGYRLDERAVEYPWFFLRLKDTARIMLDAGSVLNHRQILKAESLKGKRLYISTLYYEGCPDAASSHSYVYEDLRQMCFKDDFFDAICSLSTIEHIGLDNTKYYSPDPANKENDKYSYLEAVRELRRVLKPDGSLYLSMPFGVYKNHGWFQVFDSEMLNRLVDTFAPSEMDITYFRYENDQWNFSNEEHCLDGTCFDPCAGSPNEHDYLAFSRCVVCLELKK